MLGDAMARLLRATFFIRRDYKSAARSLLSSSSPPRPAWRADARPLSGSGPWWALAGDYGSAAVWLACFFLAHLTATLSGQARWRDKGSSAGDCRVRLN